MGLAILLDKLPVIYKTSLDKYKISKITYYRGTKALEVDGAGRVEVDGEEKKKFTYLDLLCP